MGYAHATLVELVTFGWIGPLLQMGAKGLIGEDSAEAFVDPPHTAQHLEAEFQSAYGATKALHSPSPVGRSAVPAVPDDCHLTLMHPHLHMHVHGCMHVSCEGCA